jgi:hypothetical protein
MELSFEGLLNKYSWKEIPNCPGRYVLRKKDGDKNSLTPQLFLDKPDLEINSYTTPVAKDKVYVIKFSDNGGLLSYSKPDGGYVHTLNNPSGLIRKLNHLQIVLQPDTEK